MKVLKQIADENQSKRGWTLTLNGQEVKDVTSLQLCNPRFGTLEYGATPQGYDSWCFQENGGGGSVIVPYFILDREFDPAFPDKQKELYIGLVQQDRYTMGGKVYNLPRGFLAPNENHFQAAQREAGEELGFSLTQRLLALAGDPQNPNSAFFVTGENQGVRFFGLELTNDELVDVAEGHNSTYKFRDEVLKPVSKTAELIFGSVFVHYRYALATSDMFTAAGIGRLMSTLNFELR
jgi:8-oxo-dGTP pyrophosphatase MutT (NUDIX family)